MLSSAVGLCQLRRLRRVAAAAPLPAAAIAIGILIAPIALLRVGATVGSVIASSGSTEGSVALTLGPVLAAAVAGALLALSLPGREALGAQIAAGPVGARRVVSALVLVPALGLGLVLLPSLVAMCVGVGRASAGGFWSGLALAGAVLAGIPAGAILAEGGLAATRGNARCGGA